MMTESLADNTQTSPGRTLLVMLPHTGLGGRSSELGDDSGEGAVFRF